MGSRAKWGDVGADSVDVSAHLREIACFASRGFSGAPFLSTHRTQVDLAYQATIEFQATLDLKQGHAMEHRFATFREASTFARGFSVEKRLSCNVKRLGEEWVVIAASGEAEVPRATARSSPLQTPDNDESEYEDPPF